MLRYQTAYSLPEVLLALTILTSSGFALFDLLNTRLINYQQQQQAARQLQTRYTLLTLATLLNPTTMNKDSALRDTSQLGSLAWNWDATTVVAEQQARGYDCGLYRIELYPDQTLMSSETTPLTLIRLGWQLPK